MLGSRIQLTAMLDRQGSSKKRSGGIPLGILFLLQPRARKFTDSILPKTSLYQLRSMPVRPGTRILLPTI